MKEKKFESLENILKKKTKKLNLDPEVINLTTCVVSVFRVMMTSDSEKVLKEVKDIVENEPYIKFYLWKLINEHLSVVKSTSGEEFTRDQMIQRYLEVFENKSN